MGNISFYWVIRLYIKKIRLYLKSRKILFFTKILPKKNYQKPSLYTNQKILIIRNDKHGDMIVTTGLIHSLSNLGAKVYVSSEKASLEIIKYNPYISDTFEYDDSSIVGLIKSIYRIRKYHFDLTIDLKFCNGFYFRNTIFSGLVKSDQLIGFNKSSLKCYSYSIPYNSPKEHVTKRLEEILEILNIKQYNLCYEIFINNDIEKKSLDFITENNINDKFAIINPFGSDKARHLSNEQITESLKFLQAIGYNIIMIGIPAEIQKLHLDDSIYVFNSKSILEVVPLIRKADLIFTVDTSIVHIAAAYTKSTIALYLNQNSNSRENNNRNNYRKLADEYRLSIITKIVDKDRYLSNNYISPLINHLHWKPNNKNAIQVVFDYSSFKQIPLTCFMDRIKNAYSKCPSL